MVIYTKNWLKFLLGFSICLILRLIPFRPPNVEPIMATQMPFSKAYGKIYGFLFAFLSIFLFDVLTGKLGSWTLVTAFAYGFLALWAAYYFKNKESTSINYVKFSIMGTLAYDIVTGLSIGPIFFQQPFMQALIGQIPFTMMHLVGNIGFAAIASPLIYGFVVENKKLELNNIIKIFDHKKI